MRGMKVYQGRRSEHGCAVDVDEDGEVTLLNPRRDLQHFSNDLEWGGPGKGSAQLALALAADVLGDDEKALDVAPQLQKKLIGNLPYEGWALSENRLRHLIDALEPQHARWR